MESALPTGDVLRMQNYESHRSLAPFFMFSSDNADFENVRMAGKFW
jgi:hypothetical protein